MIKIGVYDGKGQGRLTGLIKAMYGLTGRAGGRGDFSAEFADEGFFQPPSEDPFVADLAKNPSVACGANILVINALDKGSLPEPGRECRALVINSDDSELLRHIRTRRGNIITYGFNSKASVTASSVRDNAVTVCVQRAIPTLTGGKIEQQEFNVRFGGRAGNNISHLLAAVTVALVAGEARSASRFAINN